MTPLYSFCPLTHFNTFIIEATRHAWIFVAHFPPVKYVSWSNKLFVHGLPSKLLQLLYFSLEDSLPSAMKRVFWPCSSARKQLAFSSKARCLRVSQIVYGLSRICFEMTRQATMPSVEGVSVTCRWTTHLTFKTRFCLELALWRHAYVANAVFF
jgi:hypothetical protein